jgi:hypothetical protein
VNRDILSVNDLHMGVQRVTGTTPQTMARLRRDLGDRIERLFMANLDKHIFINGDIFDAFQVEMSELFRMLEICSNWLDESGEGDWRKGQPPKLAISRGNHDISKDSSRMSAFDFLCAVLKARYGDRVIVITEAMIAFPNHYVIPHMPNQEIFDQEIELAIERAEQMPSSYIHLHANYDNGFAVESDHSLNVSQQQAVALAAAGYRLIFGHEHQQKVALNGDVVIVGNQFPTSIADCLGNDEKHALVFDPQGTMWHIPTWKATGSFYHIHWENLDNAPAGTEFVRVTGKAKQEDAAKVLQAVAKFRQASDAYVVTSAVKIEGLDDVAELEVAASEMKALDVLTYLYDQLEPAQADVVKSLLAGRNADVAG